jgi:hypothetical protein
VADYLLLVIRQPTLLILGAGASAEYDFPVGRSLLLSIVDGLGRGSRLRLDMELYGFDKPLIMLFADELRVSH